MLRIDRAGPTLRVLLVTDTHTNLARLNQLCAWAQALDYSLRWPRPAPSPVPAPQRPPQPA